MDLARSIILCYKIKELSLPSNFKAENKIFNSVFPAVDKKCPIDFKHQECLSDKATFFFFFLQQENKNVFGLLPKTLPKAQRTRGLSSYHKFKHKS